MGDVSSTEQTQQNCEARSYISKDRSLCVTRASVRSVTITVSPLLFSTKGQPSEPIITVKTGNFILSQQKRWRGAWWGDGCWMANIKYRNNHEIYSNMNGHRWTLWPLGSLFSTWRCRVRSTDDVLGSCWIWPAGTAERDTELTFSGNPEGSWAGKKQDLLDDLAAEIASELAILAGRW